MTLAPIRGAPPGASIPAFPIEAPKLVPEKPTAESAYGDQPHGHQRRQRQTPIEVGGNRTTLTLAIVPEIPAIMRASMTIHVTTTSEESSSSQTLGFLRMSAQNASEFLTDLANGHSPVRAAGDEDGTVEVEFEITGSGAAVSVYRPGQQEVIRRLTIDRPFDMGSMASRLQADLGE